MNWRARIPVAHDISWLKAAAIATMITIAVAMLAESQIGQDIERKTARIVEFRIRSWLDRDPALDPRIKIAAFDDPAVATIDSKEISLGLWAELLEAYERKQPAAIFIDYTFGYPQRMAEAQQFIRRLQSLETKIVVGAMGGPEIRGLPALSSRWGIPTQRDELPTVNHKSQTNRQTHVYGPHKDIVKAFRYIGHLNGIGNEYSAFPHFAIGPDAVIPHATFWLASAAPQFVGKKIKLDGNRVHLNADGTIPVNYVSYKKLYRSLHSLSWSFKKHKQGVVRAHAKKGDFVVLLPGFHSGHTDWVESPIGRIPGGFHMASMVNSVLTGQWLRPMGSGPELIVATSAISVILAVLGTTPLLLSVGGFIVMLMIACGLLGFAYGGFVIPWLYPTLGFSLTAVIVFLEKKRIHERKSRRVKEALSGFVSPERLKLIQKNPHQLHTEACGRHLSVLFIDIVGYSVIAERLEPKAAFELLKELLNIMTTKIHDYGGVVDKTLGDGILCFFGYQYDGSRTVTDHATQAVDCAIAIQRLIVEANLRAADAGKPVFPVRIGINSDYVYIGNVGDDHRVDMTLIGDGVNFAQRLEAASDSYQILIGPSTYDQMNEVTDQGTVITKKYIQIKHHQQLTESYEVDPFAQDRSALNRAIEAHRASLDIKRKDTRIQVPQEMKIAIRTPYGDGYLHNFSPGGFAAVLPKYLGSRVNLSVWIGDQTSALEGELQSHGLVPLACEVRWGRPFDGEFLSGLMLQNLPDDHRDKLLEILRRACQSGSLQEGFGRGKNISAA